MQDATVGHGAGRLFDVDLSTESVKLFDEVFANSDGFVAADRSRLFCNLR
jgi:hypothetical protein